jgi:hypothetical protein
MFKKNYYAGLFLLIVLSGLFTSCKQTSTIPVIYSTPELKYLLIDHFGGVFYCDPDFYPVGRPELEQQNAIEQFPAINANRAEFAAILKYLNLPDKSDYPLDEKVLIYREHKKLILGIVLTGDSSPYTFTMRVGENQGHKYVGTVASSGKITVLTEETSFNTCPICLPSGTLISTPDGPMPVEKLDAAGNRIEGAIVKISKTLVPVPFLMVKLSLEDGRSITASPGHPSAAGQALGEYKVGDTLDGAKVIIVENVLYNGLATYDILPSGKTGQYWANGILLGSTLR